MDKLKPSKPETPTLTPETKQEHESWLVDELTVLAQAFDKPMTPERLIIMAIDLVDIPKARIAEAFATARRSWDRWPEGVTAKLRQLTGCLTPEQFRDAGSMDAWLKVLRHVTANGVDGTGAKAQFDERTWHAIRACGGLHRIHSVPDAELGFVKREFLEAWKGAENVQTYRTALTEGNAPKQILGAIKALADGKTM